MTASSTGIGLGISEHFARLGATVIINSRSQKHVEEAVKKIRDQGLSAEGFVCHAGKIEDIKKLVKFVADKFGRLDVLVPNAAVSTHVGHSIDMAPEQFDKLFEINLRGVFFLIKEAHALLEVRGPHRLRKLRNPTSSSSPPSPATSSKPASGSTGSPRRR